MVPFRRMIGTSEKFAEQTERANEIRECSTIEAEGIEDRVKRMSGYILYVVLKVHLEKSR